VPGTKSSLHYCRKILVFEALNLPYINVGKDPYLVTFCTEPLLTKIRTLGVSVLGVHILHQRNYLLLLVNKEENNRLGVQEHLIVQSKHWLDDRCEKHWFVANKCSRYIYIACYS